MLASFPSLQHIPETASLEENRLIWLDSLEIPVHDQYVPLSLYLCWFIVVETHGRGKSLIPLPTRESEVNKGAVILLPLQEDALQ